MQSKDKCSNKKHQIDKIFIIKESKAALDEKLKSKLKGVNFSYCDKNFFLN